MEGWIKLHRALLEWEWYDDINTKVLFIHILLKCNHKDKTWRGIDINKGSFMTGRKVLAKETGLTEQQIRTSLNKLKSTNEITIKSTNLNSFISVVKWDNYQLDNQQDNKQATKEQPTSNQRVTTTKNVNKEKNENNKTKPKQSYDYSREREVLNKVASLFESKHYDTDAKKQKWLDTIRLLHHNDKLSYDKIETVIKFAKGDDFWSRNLLSINSLRKKTDDVMKIDNIIAKMPKANNTTDNYTPDHSWKKDVRE